MSNGNWKFEIRESGANYGWEDSIIKLFKNKPYNSLAKETTQNSKDNAKITNGITEKVVLKFELLELESENIPDKSGLERKIKYCEADKIDFSNPQQYDSIEKAVKILSKPKIRVLKIEEVSGTAGMQGPCDIGKPFGVYMKGTGKSQKNETSLGSQGMGKGAPINCSDLNTIIVSTKYEEDNIEKTLIQGRASIQTTYHRKTDDEGNVTKTEEISNNIGFFGDEKYKPITSNDIKDNSKLNWLEKKEIGTNIFILGFRDDNEWFKSLMPAILINYFAAIEKDELEVIIHHPIEGTEIWKREINASSLKKNFNETFIEQFLKDKDSDVRLLDFNNAKKLWETIKNPRHVIEKSIEGIGGLTFYVGDKDDELRSHNIGLIRNKMFITNIGDRTFPLINSFSQSFLGSNIVIEASSKKSDTFFKQMEPPDHNSIKLNEIENYEKRTEAEKSLRNFKKELLKIMQNYFTEESTDPSETDIFDDWLMMAGENSESDDYNPTSGIKFIKKEQESRSNATTNRPKRRKRKLDNEDDVVDQDDLDDENDQITENPIPRRRNRQTNKLLGREIQITNPRIVISGNISKICFTPTETCELELVIRKYGADIKDKVTVLTVQEELASITESGTLRLNVYKNERVILNTGIKERGLNSILLKAYKVTS